MHSWCARGQLYLYLYLHIVSDCMSLPRQFTYVYIYLHVVNNCMLLPRQFTYIYLYLRVVNNCMLLPRQFCQVMLDRVCFQTCKILYFCCNIDVPGTVEQNAADLKKHMSSQMRNIAKQAIFLHY
jgi:hypothetical protein